ncbi:hypothetical protein HG530_001988 [Fusarium avenaceum]|nr:hypothetical protein HG530_001988 [Fusarium avenaceum]
MTSIPKSSVRVLRVWCLVAGLDNLQLQKNAGNGVLHAIALANLEHMRDSEKSTLSHGATSKGILNDTGLSSLAGKGIFREHNENILDTNLVAKVGEVGECDAGKVLKVIAHGDAVEGDTLDHEALALLCIVLSIPGRHKSKLTVVDPVEEHVSLTLVKTRNGNDAVFHDLSKLDGDTETQGHHVASGVQEVVSVEDEGDVDTEGAV